MRSQLCHDTDNITSYVDIDVMRVARVVVALRHSRG
jgi:hypothetical protein